MIDDSTIEHMMMTGNIILTMNVLLRRGVCRLYLSWFHSEVRLDSLQAMFLPLLKLSNLYETASARLNNLWDALSNSKLEQGNFGRFFDFVQ